MIEIRVSDKLATKLASGHPWVYRDHVPQVLAKTGSWVQISAGSYRAYGLWDDESPIAVRIFSTHGVPNQAWFRARIEQALALRAPLRQAGTNGYRLVFGEADFLPGLVVDIYDRFAVVVTYSKALGSILAPVVESLWGLGELDGIVRRSRTEEGARLQLLRGVMPPAEVPIEENGMRLVADLYHGQKTGLFFDHRDNRQYVREVARGRRVLNLFSYTGGFSVAAALGGAVSVTSVDVARPAIEACRRNFEVNQVATPHEEHAADVFEFLERAERERLSFDCVVCDPPSFAKSREQKKLAERTYVRLMSQAVRLVSPHGLFCAASCTSQVSPTEFLDLMVDAGRKARRRLQVVREAAQPLDHPVLLGHDEGRYLKFVAARVLERP